MKNVIVVESPTKASKIQKYFNDGTKVISSYGHIYDLPKESISIDVKNNFKPNYKPLNGKEKTIKALRDFSKTYNVLLAADDDREGDAIAWHCGKVMKVKFSEKNRIIFHEISKDAILNSIQNVHKLNMNSVNAQQARRIIDRLVGYSLSPCLWKHIKTKKSGLSAGRVQSTVLKVLNEHENNINNYEPEYSYEFIGEFKFGKEDLTCELLFTTDEIDPMRIMNILKKDKLYKLHSLKNTEEKKYPGQTLITTTLQQFAQNELGFPIKMTMNIAQKLYENGKITYMRTDSTFISESFQKTIEKKIINDFSDEYYQKYTIKKKKVKGAQEAHECIRPTDINHELNDKWSDPEKKLYNLIKKKTIISHMKPAIYDIITVDLTNKNLEEIGLFQGKYRFIKFDGFLKYTNQQMDKKERPKITSKTEFKLMKCICKDNKTTPPAYFNESSLVKKLESLGIGRPSTYATIIDTILNRNYTIVKTIPEETFTIDLILLDEKNQIKIDKEEKKINSQKNKILLTGLGKEVLKYLEDNFSKIIDINFTSDIERDLDKIAEGECDWVTIVKKVYDSFYKDTKIQMSMRINHKYDMISLGDYEGFSVDIKEGKYGSYISYNNQNITLKYILKKKDKNEIKLNDAINLIKSKKK